MNGKHDYYETLGINRGANKDEIRTAYRKLARQYHPDVNKAPDAESRIQRDQRGLRNPIGRQQTGSVRSFWTRGSG